MIPKIIHQIWFQGENNIPKTYPNYSHTWKKLNPLYEYMFWDQQSIETLIINYYPELYNKYKSYPEIIQKIDMAKYIILNHFGGIYVDLDLEALKPVDKLISSHSIIFAKYGVNYFEKIVAYGSIFGDVLENGFIASSKKNPFWEHCYKILLNENINRKLFESHFKYIFRTIGPGLLTNAYNSYKDKDKIYLLDGNYIDPMPCCDYEWNNCSQQDCRKLFPDAYAFHHCGSRHDTHSWVNNTEKTVGYFLCRFKYYLIVLLFIVIITCIWYWFKIK